MAAVIGSLRVNLGADTGNFEDGLKRAANSLGSFAKRAAEIATGIKLEKIVDKIIEAFIDLAKAPFAAIDAMDKMGKEAQKLGTSIEGLSRLSVIAKLADVELTELSKSVVQLSKRMVEGADSGTDPARRALTALGISFKSFTALKPDQQMGVLAERFSSFRDSADKTAAAVALFGRAGANLIPLLNEGSSGFRKAAEDAAKLGLVMSGPASKAAQQFNDNMKLVGLGLTQGIFNIVAEKLLPVFVLLSEAFRDATFWLLRLLGAGNKVEEVTKLLKELKMPTDEAARNAENFRKKLFELHVEARVVQGDFVSLPEGFIKAASALKLVGDNAGKLPTTFAQLSKEGKQLAFEMDNLKLNQLTAENLAPWDQFLLKITELNRLMPITVQQQNALALAAAKAADTMRSSYITATAGIAGAFGEMFTSIGGEHKGWAQAAKIAAAAQALISTFQGAALALAQGGVFGFAAAAAITAKGLALVAAIKGTPLGFAGGGSFMVPGGTSGVDNVTMPLDLASGERVTVETPEQQKRGRGQTVINLRGKSFGFDDIRDVFDQINAGMRDGHRFLVARA